MKPYENCETCYHCFSGKCSGCPKLQAEHRAFRQQTEGKVHAMAMQIWHPRMKPLHSSQVSAVGKRLSCDPHKVEIGGSTPSCAIFQGMIPPIHSPLARHKSRQVFSKVSCLPSYIHRIITIMQGAKSVITIRKALSFKTVAIHQFGTMGTDTTLGRQELYRCVTLPDMRLQEAGQRTTTSTLLPSALSSSFLNAEIK